MAPFDSWASLDSYHNNSGDSNKSYSLINTKKSSSCEISLDERLHLIQILRPLLIILHWVHGVLRMTQTTSFGNKASELSDKTAIGSKKKADLPDRHNPGKVFGCFGPLLRRGLESFFSNYFREERRKSLTGCLSQPQLQRSPALSKQSDMAWTGKVCTSRNLDTSQNTELIAMIADKIDTNEEL